MSVVHFTLVTLMSTCQKIRYRDRIAALMALAKVQRQDKSWLGKLEQRPIDVRTAAAGT